MKNQRDAIDILEQAVSLLRAASLPVLVLYLVGAIPFILAILFFLSEMTRSPFASEHLVAASFGVALAYIWKNAWQGVFSAKLYEVLSPGEARRINYLRLIAVQGTLQPVGLALMLPFPWLVAFFRNVALFTALGAPNPVRTARNQAALWTRQNWGVLAIATLGALLLFLNLLITIAILPQLARSFLGIEGDFARLGVRIALNATAVGVALALTWLVIDPLLDAVYVLRCFYGESIASGEDLRAALRRATATLVLLLVMIGAAPRPAIAQAPPVDPDRLDRSIDEVIHRREFTWRAPRPAGEETQGRLESWVRAAEEWISRGWDWLAAKIREWFESKPEAEGRAKNAPVTPRILEGLIAVVVAVLIAAAVFWLRGRRVPPTQAEAVAATPSAVDLADESVTADQLPESSWLKLAEEWLAKGDARMALRALYLAGLNYLGGKGLVSIRRWKSGLDYRRELQRRAGADSPMVPTFTRNVAIFESGWYGLHHVDRESVQTFAAGLTEMRRYAERT